MSEGAADDVPADAGQVARAIVLRRLTMAPRTRAELRRTLQQRQVPDEVAERVLDRFSEVGLVDDVQYAATFTESRRHRSGWSRRAITAKLSERGVPRDVIAEAVERMDPDDELHNARALAHTKWPRTEGLDDVVRRRRMAGLLARRGYSGSVVAKVLQELAAGDSGDDD